MVEKYNMKQFLKQIFTEPNNHTYCPVRIIAVFGAVQYLALTWANYIQHGVFAPQDFAIGFGALLGGVGVALGLKKDSPPNV